MRVKCGPGGIAKANETLARGGIVIFPTDTVYGIGCNPFDGEAVKKIYKIKGRKPAKPLPVLTFSTSTAKKIAVLDGDSEKIAAKFWPGPLTIILKIKDAKLADALCLKEKIALRVPDHRCTLELLRQCSYLVGTSANVSGDMSATDPKACEKSMSGYDLLLDGGMTAGRCESTVMELVGRDVVVHREGEIKKEEILGIL